MHEKPMEKESEIVTKTKNDTNFKLGNKIAIHIEDRTQKSNTYKTTKDFRMSSLTNKYLKWPTFLLKKSN